MMVKNRIVLEVVLDDQADEFSIKDVIDQVLQEGESVKVISEEVIE